VKRKKRILIAPLDWGLGHATRCIPIINLLQELEAEVIIATNGQALQLLQTEFPNSEFYELPAYNIKYGKNMASSIALQLPKLGSQISREHSLLQKWIEEKNIDAVISDNRFGLWTKKIPCVFITHQVNIIVPGYLALLKKIIFWLNRSFISKYNELWIPDFEGENNLSGKLSHSTSNGRLLRFARNDTHYIGTLSRLHSCNSKEKEYAIAVILSGPEPHRTILEKVITEQLVISQYSSIIIQGKTGEKKEVQLTPGVKTVSYLNGKELNEVMCSSAIIISRSGYSTIMDTAVTGAKAIFIPTPGQTEQEYLAAELKRKELFYYENQKEFLLERSIKESENYSGLHIKNSSEALQSFLIKWLERI
jgi:uncharacterized protein (TIGR00661 family)